MTMKLVPALLSLLLAIVPRAEAVTVRDIIELSRAGLSEEVLVALIEADPSVFDLQAGQILELKAAGVAENVIIAMLHSLNGGDPCTPPSSSLAGAPAPRSAPRPPQRGDPGTPPSSLACGAPSPQAARSRREFLAPSAEPRASSLAAVVVPVAVPVLVPMPVPIVPRHGLLPMPAGVRGFGRFINDGFISEPVPAPSEPIYWGWGGKRRPDTWQERTRQPLD